MAELWPFEPIGLTVRLSWLTSLLSTYETEQRARLRQLYPRASFTLTALHTQDETLLARSLVERAEGEFLVPDWRYPTSVAGPFSGTSLSMPVDDDYFYPVVGDQVVAWKSEDDFHVFTIDARGTDEVTADRGPPQAMSGFVLLPVLPAYASGPVGFRHGTNNVNRSTLRAETRSYKDLVSYAAVTTEYQSVEVFTERDVLLGQHTGGVHKVVTTVDSATGTVVLEEAFDHVDLDSTLSMRDRGPLALMRREAWLHVRAGRLEPFWKPTWGSDLILLDGALTGAMELEAIPHAYDVPPSYYIGRHFCVDQGGSLQFFEVAGASVNNSGYGAGYGTYYGSLVKGDTLTLTLASGLTADVILDDVTTVSEMNMVRLGADEVDLSYEPGLLGSFSVPLAGLDDDV